MQNIWNCFLNSGHSRDTYHKSIYDVLSSVIPWGICVRTDLKKARKNVRRNEVDNTNIHKVRETSKEEIKKYMGIIFVCMYKINTKNENERKKDKNETKIKWKQNGNK